MTEIKRSMHIECVLRCDYDGNNIITFSTSDDSEHIWIENKQGTSSIGIKITKSEIYKIMKLLT